MAKICWCYGCNPNGMRKCTKDTLKAENARLREALEKIANAHVTWYERTPESILSGCKDSAKQALKGGSDGE